MFAEDEKEKRLHFKPMQRLQRRFLHLLAEDYGFDSESMDPEPLRHVCIFKTHRFVSAPRKTLAEAAKIRATQAAQAARLAGSAPVQTLEPFNAMLLSSPRFGLTIDEVDSALAANFATASSLTFTTAFLPSDEILIRAAPKNFASAVTPAALEATLVSLKPAVAKTISQETLAGGVVLCHTDSSLRVDRRERGVGSAAAGGWSTVASRAAQRQDTRKGGPAQVAEPTVTRSFVGLKKKKPAEQETIVDDWQTAAEKLDD
jgi:transcriptional repressor NF-X1